MTSKQWPQILRHITDAYIHTGQPVGSSYLVEMYELSMSTATVRNVMAALTEQGFLFQPHTSAGRVPSAKAYRYYVQNFLRPTNEQPVDSLNLVELAQANLDDRYEVLNFISQQLSLQTSQLGIAMMENRVAISGVANLLRYADVIDINRLRQILALAENVGELRLLFERLRTEGVRFYIGDENDLDIMQGCTLAIAKSQIGRWPTYMGVIGPMSMPYDTVLKTIHYLSGLDY